MLRRPLTQDEQRLVADHEGLARFMAWRVAIRIPGYAGIGYDDLIQYGCLGLIDAAQRFNPQINQRFETYAIRRIQGSIMDGLRAWDTFPRSWRARENRVPERERLRYDYQSGMDWLYIDNFNEGELAFEFRDPDESSATKMSRRDDARVLMEMIEGLPPTYQTVIRLYYYEGLTMKAISEVIDRTESRVSQIHVLALKRLRAAARRRMGDLTHG